MKWVIFGKKERGEMGMSTRENYDRQPILQFLTDGTTPCVIYEEFEADDYDTARSHFRTFMGHSL